MSYSNPVILYDSNHSGGAVLEKDNKTPAIWNATSEDKKQAIIRRHTSVHVHNTSWFCLLESLRRVIQNNL